MKPVVLDVTRTLSPKSIAHPTGIDRVERAYIEYFLNNAPDAQYLCKLGRKLYLTDREIMLEDFSRVLSGKQDARKYYSKREPRVWSELGRLLGLMHREKTPHLSFPTKFNYLNVGQTNLNSSWLKAVRKVGATKIIGLVHDMIPLDDPQLQTPKSVKRFEMRMKALSMHSDLIFTNSEYTAERTRHWFSNWGRATNILSNPLGVETPSQVPPVKSHRPYFVVLGTIEPRKNHALLLKVWESFADLPELERPVLHIIGRRGWMNEDVFKILDTSSMIGRDVFEHGTLSDDGVAGFLRGAEALLFPSLTEGFGLPLLEAKSVGTRTLVSDIPVFQELACPDTLYLDPYDANVWRKAIIKQLKQGKSGNNSKYGVPFKVPNWSDHFALIERHLEN